ncbi:MAG: tetratricopeptide repeat protein [Bacteroidota bacterium]
MPIRYFLFLGTLLFFFGCSQNNPNSYRNMSKEERRIAADTFYNSYAYKSYQGSRYNQAMYDTLIRIDPFTEKYYRQKSITHTKIGDYHIAFPLLEKSARLDPKESLYYYSWLLIELYRDYPRALDYLEQFDTLTPNQVDYAWGINVHHLRGLCYKQLGQYEKAVETFNQCVASEPYNAVDVYTFVYRGICHYHLQNSQAALADFDEAIRRYSRCSMAYYNKGKTLWELDKNAPEARKHLLKAKELVLNGHKKTDPYIEVFDEVYVEMVEEVLAEMD